MQRQELFWLNGWVTEKELILNQNRSFLYGDGFFESMRWKPDGTAPLWPYHWDRLNRSIEALRFPAPAGFCEDFFTDVIQSKLPHFLGNDVRVKLLFWRHGEGHYLAQSTETAMMFVLEPCLAPWIQTIENVDIATEVFIPHHPLSWIKTTSSMLYVAAANERHRRGLDDVVLCNQDGYVIEGNYSCLFWGKNNRIYAPNPAHGGLDSCMRRYLSDFWAAKNIPFVLASEKWSSVPEIDWIGFGSGMGLRIKIFTPGSFDPTLVPQF